MIQLRTLALLLAAGLSGSAWAQETANETQKPVAETAPKLPQPELVQPIQQDQQNPLLYAWDRVGKPLGKESFFI
jgi:hypothetical protein